MGGNNSNYNRKSGGTGFLITAGIVFLALRGLPGLLLGVVIGAGVGAIASIVGKKLDTTTHNRRDREREAQEELLRRQEEERRRREEASKIPLTGNQQADNVIRPQIHELLPADDAESPGELPSHAAAGRFLSGYVPGA